MPKLQLGRYYRVVVTGDRYWPKEGWYTIKGRLELLKQETDLPILVITGGAQGADTMADLAAHLLGYKTKIIEAEWNKYGKRAGPVRNIRMLEEFRPHIVLAFHNDLESSKGTRHCMKAAETRKVLVEHLMMI